MSEAVDRSVDPGAAFAGIARALAEGQELGETLSRIASAALALSRADAASVALRRGDEAEFVAYETAGDGPHLPLGHRLRPRPEMLAVLRRRRSPLLIQDVQASPLIPPELKPHLTVRDLIVVPVRADGALVGALNLAFRALPEDWTADAALLNALGDLAAAAVRRAELHEASQRSTERLVQSEKLSALGQLIARVAHELNKPLTTTRLLAEMLETEPLPGTALDHARTIAREMEHASAVVRDLLLLARKRTGEFEPVSLAEAVHDAVTEQARQLAAAGVRVSLDLAADLPAVQADRRGLRHVLTNLLHNAVQALETHPGERRIVVRAWVEDGPPSAAGNELAAQAPSDRAGPRAARQDAAAEVIPGALAKTRVVVTIADSGPGIPAEALPHLFEPFFTTKGAGEGTGMGLTIVREIIAEHGGVVQGANARQGGGVFRFTLPVAIRQAHLEQDRPAQQAPDTAAAEARDAADPESAGPPRGLRVLVIDDEPGLQRAIRRVLEHFGCQVTSSPSGDDGFARARAEPYDLILCDVRMPGLDGRELYQRLEGEAPAAAGRLAFMTGDTISDEVRQFLRTTGRPALAKPFGRAQLAKLLRQMGGGEPEP